MRRYFPFIVAFTAGAAVISAAWILYVLRLQLELAKAQVSRSGNIRVADITQTNTFNLANFSGNAYPSGIDLRVYGRIDGAVHIYAEGWETTKLSGPVEWKSYHDWYSTSCVLHYIPESVRSGDLTIEYDIR